MGIYALFYNFFINSKRKKDMYINNNSSYPFVVVKLTTLEKIILLFLLHTKKNGICENRIKYLLTNIFLDELSIEIETD